LTDPLEYPAAERLPRSITPEPVIVILSVGWIFALMTSPFIVPVAVPGNVSFHTIVLDRAPLPTTDPVPILVAADTLEMRVIVLRRAHAMSLFVFVRIKMGLKNNMPYYSSILSFFCQK
jgi:hypothetical protein